MNNAECEICKKSFPEAKLITGHGIRHEIEDLIRNDYPDWTDNSRICKTDFNIFRVKYIARLIEDEKGSIEVLEDAVINSIRENEIISFNTNVTTEQLRIGDRISDKVASFGGSWKFIISFSVIPEARYSSMSETVILISRIHGFPLLFLGSIVII